MPSTRLSALPRGLTHEGIRTQVEASDGCLPKAAEALGVSHATLWRYMKENKPDGVVPRRKKVFVDEIPDSVCLDIFTDRVLKKVPISTLVAQYDISAQTIRLLVERGGRVYRRQKELHQYRNGVSPNAS